MQRRNTAANIFNHQISSSLPNRSAIMMDCNETSPTMRGRSRSRKRNRSSRSGSRAERVRSVSLSFDHFSVDGDDQDGNVSEQMKNSTVSIGELNQSSPSVMMRGKQAGYADLISSSSGGEEESWSASSSASDGKQVQGFSLASNGSSYGLTFKRPPKQRSKEQRKRMKKRRQQGGAKHSGLRPSYPRPHTTENRFQRPMPQGASISQRREGERQRKKQRRGTFMRHSSASALHGSSKLCYMSSSRMAKSAESLLHETR